MFVQVWRKYLPVIRILLKKSATDEQLLDISSIDFTRAAGGRKIKFTFDARLSNGKLAISDKQTPLAKDLVGVLQEDDQAKKLLARQELELSMNSSFQLRIKNTTPAEEITTEDSTAETEVMVNEK